MKIDIGFEDFILDDHLKNGNILAQLINLTYPDTDLKIDMGPEDTK